MENIIGKQNHMIQTKQLQVYLKIDRKKFLHLAF